MNIGIFNFIHQFVGRSFWLDAAMIFFALYFPYILGITALVLPLFEKRWRLRWLFYFELISAAILSRGILTEIVRYFYIHPRPFDYFHFTPLIPESGNSFPSGHAAFFFAIAIIILFWKPKWGWFFIGSAVVLSLARIYVGVHWPLDIIGGMIIGLISGFTVYYLFGKIYSKIRSQKQAEIS
ncbi:MAG: phosphatase PAP2 family protein [Patescibacteria group bacterium]|nr:phosphatase PAP2 family protein [Patescibacteria group bacterium]